MRVLIIEDDPMVAMIHQEYIKKVENIHSLQHVTQLEEAKQYIEQADIVLVDNYLPDGRGIDFLKNYPDKVVIMITAANDVDTVKKALAYGVTDYLVKPFTFERFLKAFDKAKKRIGMLSKEKISQEQLDNYFDTQPTSQTEGQLPKGLAKITLKKIGMKIIAYDTHFTTQQLAETLDISRITIKKYLNYLVTRGLLLEDADYLTLGRPVSVYSIVDKQDLLNYIIEKE